MKQFLADYGAIAFGLVIGTMAHFGRLLSDGERPTMGEAFGFVLQLGFIGVVAVVCTRLLSITDSDMRALATAILAISAQEVIRYLKSNGWLSLLRPVAKDD